MTTATDILVGTGTVVGIVWLATFICALGDKLSGNDREDDTEDEEDTGRPIAWRSRKGIMLLALMPLTLILSIAIAVLVAPPMFLVEVIWPKRPQPPDGRADAATPNEGAESETE